MCMSRNSSILKTKTGNESPLTIYGQVSDSKSCSLQMKKGYMSPLKRYGRVSDPKNSLKMTKANESPLRPSTGGIRRSSTDTNLKIRSGNMSPYAMSPFSTCTRRCDHVSDNDGVYKMGRGRTSPFALSPLSPNVRAYGYVSDSHSSSKMKRASLSPLALSPLSPYVRRTNGHVSD